VKTEWGWFPKEDAFGGGEFSELSLPEMAYIPLFTLIICAKLGTLLMAEKCLTRLVLNLSSLYCKPHIAPSLFNNRSWKTCHWWAVVPC